MSGRKGYIVGLLSGVGLCLAAGLLAWFLVFGRGGAPGFIGQSARAQGAAAGGRQGLPDTAVNKINEIYRVLDRHYVDGYDKAETLSALYQGLVYGIGDPYTVYMNNRQFGAFMQDTEGSFAGLGIVVSVDEDDNRIVVVSPFEGCPGARAGILARDKIIRVNGAPVSGEALDEAVSRMKGEPGTSVTVTIYRESENKEMDFTITRENIEVPTVVHKMLDGGVGYIRITQFSKVTAAQFTAALSDLKAGGMKALALDLRNNPGGLLNVVCDITDALVPEGSMIVYTEDKNGNRETTTATRPGLGLPLIVLVNGGSASASEVLSGAVKDLGAGELLGERTFGKGLVQNIFELSDGSAVKVTIAKYYTPGGVCIQGEGIEPHYTIEMDEALYARISELEPEEDPQLSRAVEILKGKAGQ